MYKANPRVNDELRQRLPSPGRSPRTPPALSPRSPPCSPPRSPHTSYKRLVQTRSPQSRSPPRSPGSHRAVISPDHTCSPAPPSSPHRKSPFGPKLGLNPGLNPGLNLGLNPGLQPGPKPGPCVMEAELKADRMEPSSNQSAVFQDRDKNVSFLLKELDSLRDLNSQLQERLVQKEKELQRRDLDQKLRPDQTQTWTRTTELVEQLMAAQKEREQAMMSRLLLANEERDQALLTAQRLTQAAANQFSLGPDSVDDCDVDVLALLEQVCSADSAQEVEQLGAALVQCVRSARRRRSDITAQEMNAVMEERDAHRAQVKRLEDEQQREIHILQAELVTLQRERDSAVGERRRVEAELQELRANPGPESSTVQTEAPPLDDEVTAPLPDDVDALRRQLLMMSQQRTSAEAELVQANERVRRLERLVEVLRKKVGTGNARAIV